MTTAVGYLIASSVLFAFLCLIYRLEDVKGKRIFLPTLRSWLDNHLALFLLRVWKLSKLLWSKLIHLVLDHGLSRLLSIISNYTQSLEIRISNRLLKHQALIQNQRRSRTHLDDIADHKEAVALTDTQKQKMRDG